MENYSFNPYGMSFKQLQEEAARQRCLICGLVCKDAPDLSHHRQNKHPRFTCGRCQYKCMTINRFIAHLNSDVRCKKHFDGEVYPCNAEPTASSTEDTPSQPIIMSGNYQKIAKNCNLFLSLKHNLFDKVAIRNNRPCM